NSAKDDAAGLGIATRMTSQTRGLSMAIRNANDGISLMQTSEGALNEVTDILQRMRELAVQASTDTNSAADRVALNDEVTQLKAEIERISTTTEFNNQKLLDGSFTGKSIQIGDKAGQTLAIDIQSSSLSNLGLDSGDAIVGTRMNLTSSGTTWAAGDITINDQSLEALTATEDIGDIIDNINRNVDGVTASGFNEIVAKQVGDGKTTAGQMTITVTPLGSAAAQTIAVAASETMDELVANINNQASGLLTASKNDDGKLVLSNDTGAAITIVDGSATSGYYNGGSGFLAASTRYEGFLKIESDTGAPVRVGRGLAGTATDLAVLGFRETTSDYLTGDDAYTVTGIALTEVGAATAWASADLKINGVAIYDVNVTTTTFETKLDAINNFSDDTGVIASAYFDQTLKFTAIAGTFLINGVTATPSLAGGSGATTVANINAITAKTGITATLVSGSGAVGAEIRLTGNVSRVSFTGTAGVSGDPSLGTEYYAGIRLNSVANEPIKIELGDDAAVAEHGLLEANVGAADFETNEATMGTYGTNGLSNLNVSTVANATKAITSLDTAIGVVSDMRSKLGATQNRLNSTVDNLSNIVMNTEASRSRIQDTDYAAETTQLAKAQIIQQAATAMLAQANQQPQMVMSLLQ
ncbi:MAG: flagellin, partial [Burkholderiaceae bacterium]|nr:flagellin [Burkholderiaceae bacterium]